MYLLLRTADSSIEKCVISMYKVCLLLISIEMATFLVLFPFKKRPFQSKTVLKKRPFSIEIRSIQCAYGNEGFPRVAPVALYVLYNQDS